MLYVAIWYVSIRPVVMRVKEGLVFSQDPNKKVWVCLRRLDEVSSSCGSVLIC